MPTISKMVCVPASDKSYSDDWHTLLPPALLKQVKSFIFVLQLCFETNDYHRSSTLRWLFVSECFCYVCGIDAHLQCIFPETCVFVNMLGCSLKTQLLSNLPSSQVWKRLALFKLSKCSPTAVNTK